MNYFDNRYKLFIANPDIDPLNGINVNKEKIHKTLSSHIISASGWRSIYAASGDEEDKTENISDENKIIVTMIARAFFEELKKEEPHILIGIDARPTGPLIATIFMRTLLALKANIDYVFISAAPELMAYSNNNFDAFAYISASHNPIGHNGFKFGINGGVYSRETADRLSLRFRALINDDIAITKTIAMQSALDCTIFQKVLNQIDFNKALALSYYKDFVLKTAGVDDTFKSDVKIVAELNGSARGASIDIPFLTSINVEVHAINDKPRQVVHAIVPEGENLELCRKTLKECHEKDKRYILGYCPDNDGDRGNFSYIDDDGNAKIIEAQELFALICSIELADGYLKGVKNQAVAVNGPTSQRIDEIATLFDTKVFRAEVGEANVVNLAQSLRDEGYHVHILGEGSNGGNITDPAKVRDPLNSIMSILKFLENRKLFALMMDKFNCRTDKISISSLLKALPDYTTTGAFSKTAIMHVNNTDYRKLKANYEKELRENFPPDFLKKAKITSYEIRQTEGIVEKFTEGEDGRSGLCKGGLKVVFKTEDGKTLAYIWFRPSGTEPVLRVLADVKGNDTALHDKLIEYQRWLIAKSDCR